MAQRFPGVPPRPQPPRSPATPVLAAGTWLPPSAAAPRTDCRVRCPTRSCPCATTPPATGRVRIRCWSARRPPRGQRSTVRTTTMYADHRSDPTTPVNSEPSSTSMAAPPRLRLIRNPTSSAVTAVHSQARRCSWRQPVSSMLTTAACSTSSRARYVPRCPGWPPRFRPEGRAFGRAGVWGGSDDGGREKLAEFCPSRASSSRMRA
jgi:hypothetical protein